MKELKLYIRVFLTPSLWSKAGITSTSWDSIVRELLADKEPLTILPYNEAKLGPVVIVMRGNWHSLGRSEESWDVTRRTKLLLKDYLEAHTLTEFKKTYSKLHKALK